MERMQSMVFLFGERPPCTQKIYPSTMAAIGRKSKASLKQYQALWLPYFLLISQQKPYMYVMFLDQWLPLRSTMRSGYLSLYKKRRSMVYTELQPLSTQSPNRTYRYWLRGPPRSNISSTSQNWPWTSPQMVTGACTGCTLDYQKSRDLTLRHSTRTASSGRTLHCITMSIIASIFMIQGLSIIIYASYIISYHFTHIYYRFVEYHSQFLSYDLSENPSIMDHYNDCNAVTPILSCIYKEHGALQEKLHMINIIEFNKRLLNKLVLRMEAALTGKKLMAKNKKLLDDLIKRRHVYYQGFEIYGGCAGLYDFGPVGCAIKNNVELLWRQHFVLQEQMLQINCTCITPQVVLQHSGHVARFTDLLVKDVKNNQGFRADKLLSEWLEAKIEKGKLKEAELEEYKKILVNVDNYKKEEMAAIFKRFQIKSPETGNELSDPEPFNLMFKTEIGPSTNFVGYLRPETAQGMFVNFNKLIQFNGGRLPFAAAQIGLGFRNEIAPRNGLVRVREFQMAEIEHFVDPLNKLHPKFKYVAHIKLPLYSAKAQQQMKQPEWMQIGKAVELKIVDNETLGYFLARIFLFLKEVGINVEKHLRFRQHMKNEMAHYAQDCWDAQAEISSGWLEIVGCADRSAYDLTQHSLGSGTKLYASRKFKEARPEKQTSIIINKQLVGKEFKKNSQAINAHLDNASQEEKEQLRIKFETDGHIEVTIGEVKATLTKDHIQFEQKIVNVVEQKYTPSVIEPSFGLGRILHCVFEHSFQVRDEKRTYLCLKPRIAPVKVSILPLQNEEKFIPIIADIRSRLKKNLITCKVDDTGQSIGKRYSRTDEIGIPFGITIDFQTLTDQTITLRELHTMKQLRLPISDIEKVLVNLSQQFTTWEQICKQYPAFEIEAKDE